ncbi:hypothetical protein B0T09DRAFT_341247 [Sordaria sp. MPI-SDFR-AT-0083]|nr:hypothetical protein B0T09DRAFT_341247 [Sordaria sp. MPI-SDFR-AT-0083]
MIPPTTSSISTILLYLAVQVARQVRADPNAPCYFPGGEFAPGYFACQAFNAPVSSCCPAGWTCFSNALCIATTESNSFPNLTLGAVQRGACTNPQWNNNICGSACLENENRKGKLAACGNDRFCCAADFNEGKCDCSTKDERAGPFIISAGLAQTIIQVSDTTFSGSPSLSIASTRATGTKASTTGSITQTTGGPSTSDSLPSSPKPTSGQTASSAPTTAPAAPPVASSKGDDDNDSSGSSSSNGLKIGLGVGIPLAVLAVAGALAYFLWWRPRQTERARRISQQQDNYFQSTDLAENDPHGPARYEPYRQAAT